MPAIPSESAASRPASNAAKWLGLAGVLFLVLAVAPRYESELVDGVTTKTISFGLPFSPLYARVERTTHSQHETGAAVESTQWGWTIELASWSLASLVLGVGLQTYARVLKRRAGTPQ